MQISVNLALGLPQKNGGLAPGIEFVTTLENSLLGAVGS